MNNPLNILTIGAGAIGTYIGGSLALKGHQVVFIEQPKVAEDLKSNGLKLKLQDLEHHIPNPTICTSLEKALETQTFDIALYALKSYDTSAFIDSLFPVTAIFPPILCLSNGINNEPALGEALGQGKVIPGTVTSAIGRRGTGDIILEKLRGIGVAAKHPMSKPLVNAMVDAGLNAKLFSSANDMKWSKMLTNLISNASSAILGLPPGIIFSHPGLYWIENMQLRETIKVMKAQGIKIIDLPGTPVRLLGLAVRCLPLRISRLLLSRAVIGGRGEKMPSFYIDLHSGRGKSEVDYLNGAVVRVGEKYGIPTPVNRFLNETLKGLTTGEMDSGVYQNQPDKFLNDCIAFCKQMA